MQSEIRGYFEAEARELIDRLTQGVAGLRPDEPEDAAAMRDLMRAAHTLKGAAHVVGERGIATDAHAFEDAMTAYRAAPSQAGVAGLMAMVDGLAEDSVRPVVAVAPVAVAQPVHEAPVPVVSAPAPVVSAPVVSAPVVSAPVPRAVRVDIAQTDALLEAATESTLLLEQIKNLIAGWTAVRLDDLSPELRALRRAEVRRMAAEQMDRLERQLRGIHRAASQLRLARAEPMLLEAGRVVRATAAALGKEATCVTSGGGERVEVQILDALQDALLHLLRNALAHGVETAAERQATGKARVATVRVSVVPEGNHVLVHCADDGRGIDGEGLRRRALELGLDVPAAEQEVLALLLRPEFHDSGARGPVDEVSGRGVGLDAVQAAMAQVGGSVAIATRLGLGTTFTLRVPQAVFATRTLEVVVGGARFGLPLDAVEHTFRWERHHTQQQDAGADSRTLLVGQEMMPFVRLQDAFPLQTMADDARASGICVVLHSGNLRGVVLVDEVVGPGEALIQTLPGFVRMDRQVAGMALQANGVPYPIVDVAGLFQWNQTALRGDTVGKMTQAEAPKPILVIDDSLTTRMLEQSILETEGYEVELATSAEMGLDMARRKNYALFLVDVEMPGMNGYEFVTLVSRDEALKTTPAILVTSLDSPQSRERGRQAGAVGYFVKGEFNQQMYLDRIRALVGGAA